MVSDLSQAIEAFKLGKLIIIYDEDSEKEGDLAISAEKVTSRTIAMLAKIASGLICLALPIERLEALEIPRLPRHNCLHGPNFFMPVDLTGQHSGISAEERAQTIKAMVNPGLTNDQISYPGHLILLGAARGGLRERQGHTEGVVELARLAGLYPAGVLCEVMSTDGDMKRGEDLLNFAQVLGITVITIEDLLQKGV